MSRSIALGLALLFGLAAPAGAQMELAVSPIGGVYLPSADVLNRVPTEGGQVVAFNISHDPHVLFGGRLSFRFSRLGVEAEAAYTPSDLDIIEDREVIDDASVFLGSVNLIFVLFEAPFSPFSVHATGGVGLVNHGGDLFEFFEDTTDPAGSFGLGIRFGLGPLAQIRVDVRDYIYSFEPSIRNVDADLGSQLQNDVLATVGLEFTFSPTP